MQVLEVPPAPAETHEDLLHENAPERSLLVFPESRNGPWLSARRGHRAIGVVYQPDLDRRRNWVPTIMGRRYDAFIYIDETRALRPLHTLVSANATPETYPWGT
jgi:erythromycin esterase-like protein